MQRVGKMGEALIRATHARIDAGHNTGRLGRIVLTAEASMKSSKQVKSTQVPALLKKVA